MLKYFIKTVKEFNSFTFKILVKWCRKGGGKVAVMSIKFKSSITNLFIRNSRMVTV